MQKLIFLGYVVDPKTASEYFGISIAGNKMQWNVLKELSKSDEFSVDCLTITPLAVFPKQKKLFQKKEKELLFDKVNQTKVGYCNLPIIKQLWQTRSIYREACKLLRKNPNAILFGFNLFPQIGIPMRKLKKKFPLCKTVSLLADLPIDDKTDRKGFSKWLRSRFDRSTWKNIEECEQFIVLNEYVAKTYLNGKPYIVIDGGVDAEEIKPYNPLPKTKKNILFCGALTEYNGILNLLKAMEHVNDADVTLDIYGGGYLEKTVSEYVSTHNNVFYHGKVSNEQVIQKQREAWLLINPRTVDDLIAKVTFPSKTFEYMLSGTPILTTKLNGYGEEYEDKMFFIKEDSPLGIATEISRLVEMDNVELVNIAKKAYTFIIKDKTWEAQVKKIVKLLQEGKNA